MLTNIAQVSGLIRGEEERGENTAKALRSFSLDMGNPV